jgi:trehalose 6-phosphate phosphatase
LKLLSSEIDLDAFFSSVRRADHRLLLLDYDGTLAPFTAQRDEAVPYPVIRDLLQEILPLRETRMVIVSGRAIDDLAGLIGLSPLPEIWGSHGWERLSPATGRSVAALDEASRKKLREAAEFLGALNRPGLCEVKAVSVAAHWRGRSAEEIDLLRALILAGWSRIAEGSRLELHPFDGGLELRPRGRDKGSAVGEILSELHGTLAAAYLGDDLTDEDAFRALGPKGLSVLVRRDFRPTLADLWIRPPDELADFLARWRDACARG